MYCHKKDYEIRYTDLDFKDELKLSSLLSVMEESACLSADELGFGYSVLQPKNYGFIMVNWYVELFKPIKLGSVLSVHTWPIEPGRIIVLRDYELYVGDEKVGVATSRWCLVDLKTFKMIPAALAFEREIEYNKNRSVEFANFKIAEIPEGEHTYSKAVSYSDYDHYDHINNTKYADFLLDAFTVDELKGKSLKNIKITYVKQSKQGETLDFFRQRQADGSWTVEGRVGGELRVQMNVVFYE
ncbi:MAG: hypothetical protein K2O67_04840 [Clostridia bacterium]|nr:hypothetical protein [Clostridia bacterium]